MASVMLSSHLILWCPPFLLPSTFPSIRDFSNESQFASDDQNTGASASAALLPVNIQGFSPLRLTGLISLLSKGLSVVFSSTTVLIYFWATKTKQLPYRIHYLNKWLLFDCVKCSSMCLESRQYGKSSYQFSFSPWKQLIKCTSLAFKSTTCLGPFNMK